MSAPTKVLHVGVGNMYGGIEAMLIALAASSSGFDVLTQRFATCFDGRLATELRDHGAAVDLLGAVRISRPHTVWRARRAARRLIHDRAIDVAVLHGPWIHCVLAPAVRDAEARLVLYAHAPLEPAHWIDRWAARTRPDLVLCNSSWTAASVPRLLPGAASAVVAPIVDVAMIAAARDTRALTRAAEGVAPHECVIVQVARMEPWKGQRFLIDALARMETAVPWRCWIIGGAQSPTEAAYERELAAAIEAHGLGERVRLLGQRRDVPALLAAADVFCQPNIAPEPFGVAIVEALAAGLPVVAAAAGGALDIVVDECAVTYPPGSPEEFVRVVTPLLEDRARRERMGAAGRLRAEVVSGARSVLPRLAAALRRTLVPGSDDASMPWASAAPASPSLADRER